MGLVEWPTSVFLTGASGFIGRHLVRVLLDARCDVSALVLPDQRSLVPRGVRVYEGDITDPEAVTYALRDAGPHAVIHLAAIGVAQPVFSMDEACRVNVCGVIHLLQALQDLPSVQRIVLAGTSYEYGARRADDGIDPFNAYSASKAAAWAFARAAHNMWQLPVVLVRPFQVYGPGQSRRALIPSAISAALLDQDFEMTGGEQLRDFVFVDDVVLGIVAALHAPRIEGRVLDLATGEMHRVRDVVSRIWALTGSRGRVLIGALPYRSGEVTAIPANVHRTRLLTGWEAKVPLDQGLGVTVQALREEAKGIGRVW